MKVRALKTFYGDGCYTRKGEVVDIAAYRARMLVAWGMAAEILDAAGSEDPFGERQSGGRTGEGKPRSLSEEGQALEMRTFSPQETAQDFSALTKDTGSLHGQTSSTPVTMHGGKRGRGRPRSRD